MKSFIQFILEVTKSKSKKPQTIMQKYAERQRREANPLHKPGTKPSSHYDIGHYNKPKDMKQVDLYHMGTRSSYAEINHHTHWKESNQRRAKSGWEGKVTPNNANHGTWEKTNSTEHYAQGRIDHKLKKFTVNGSNKKMEERARNHMSKDYPEYSEHHISD